MILASFAQEFVSAFPDLAVRTDRLTVSGGYAIYHWTLTGTNTGPGGTGKPVRICGFEEWRFDSHGLFAESMRHFDAADYPRQLNAGAIDPS
jgi:hypothetical protein